MCPALNKIRFKMPLEDLKNSRFFNELLFKGMFVCGKDELSDHLIRCLQPDQVCNGKPQCPHGEDEGKLLLKYM